MSQDDHHSTKAQAAEAIEQASPHAGDIDPDEQITVEERTPDTLRGQYIHNLRQMSDVNPWKVATYTFFFGWAAGWFGVSWYRRWIETATTEVVEPTLFEAVVILGGVLGWLVGVMWLGMIGVSWLWSYRGGGA